MTVTSQTARNDYNGNGATTQFPVTFRFLENSQLKVLRTVISSGVTTTLVLDAVGGDGYAVSGAQQPNGGQVTLNVAPPVGTRISILRNVPVTQETDYLANDPFPAETHERALDKLTMIVQQQVEITGRAIVLPAQSVGVSTELPGPVPLNLLRWNAAANALENGVPPEIATVAPGAVVDATVSPIAGIQATKLSWQQAGTGSVAENVQNELRRIIRPEQFGAVGDGVTNDTAAFNRARDYLISLPCGGTILCAPGKTYAFGSRWSITKTAGKQVIVDMNGCTFTKTAGGWAGAIMYFGNPTDVAGAYPLVLRNGIFQGVGAAGTGLILEWAGNTTLSGVVFRNFVQSVSLTNCFAVRFDQKCQFLYNDTAAIICNTESHNLTVDGCGFYVNQRDIYFITGAPAYNVNLVNCDFEGSLNAGSNAIVMDQGGGCVNITGCYLEGKNGAPIVFGAAMSGLRVTNNWIGFNTGSQQWGNINSGILEGNIFWDQAQTVLSSVKDFDIGHNAYAGTSNQIFTPWQTPTFTNGFSNTGGTWAGNVAGFRKDRNGVVHLRGMVQSTSDASAFSLPAGYRPAGLTSFITTSANGGKTDLARVQVSAGGAVTVFRGTDTSADLSCVSFTAQQ